MNARRMTRVAVVLLGLLASAPPARAVPVPVAAVGETSPFGLPFSRLSEPALDDRGRLVFLGGSVAIFRRTPAGLVHQLGAGDVTAAGRVAGVGPPALGDAGCFACRVEFVGGAAGVLRSCDGALAAIAQAGEGAPRGSTFAAFGEEVDLDAAGRVAFTATLADGTTAILVGDGVTPPVEVVRTGDASPAGGSFTGFRLVGVGAGGRVGFRGSVTGGRDGLFFSAEDGLAKLAVTGDATPAGGSFATVGFAAVNGADLWAFRATLADGRSGVFLADAAAPVPLLQAVMLQGDPTPLGGTFQQFPSSLVPSIDAAGAVAFRATLEGASAPSGVFVVPRGGLAATIVAAGEETAAGALVRLREVALGDDGSVVVRASLTDGTLGLFQSRGGVLTALARLGDATDLGGGFRFSDASVRERSGDALFLGHREALLLAGGAGGLELVAALGDPSPVGGTFAAFDPPAAGGRQVAFGASVQGGRVAEALFGLGRRGPVVLAKAGARARRGTRLLDIFAAPLDDLARPGVGPGGVAFQGALGGRSSGSAVLLASGRLRTLAIEGGRAPGGGSYRAFGTPAVVSRGRVAFVAEVGSRRLATLVQAGRRSRVLAEAGRETGTRLRGVVRTFDTPTAGAGGITFRAVLDDGREGVFFAHGTRLAAVASSGDREPGGGGFRTFRTPVVAGARVVFRADLQGAGAGGLYHAPLDGATPSTAVAVAGTPSPLGGVYVAFGPPAGNRTGAIAYTADLTAAPTTAVLLLDTVQ